MNFSKEKVKNLLKSKVSEDMSKHVDLRVLFEL